jgi:sugar-specific transcriptional regulator TrmB
MNQKLKNTLIDLGLTDKEASIYLGALALGPTTILKIAQNSGLKRTTAYSIIESLKQKGLINIEIRGWKKLFVAENPKKLKSLLEEKKQSLEETLPNFLSIYNTKGDENAIKYFEGLTSVKSVYNSLIEDIKSNQDYLVIADQEKWQELDKEFFTKFIERRGKLNINIKLLLEDSPSARDYYQKQKNYNSQIKILPKKTTFSANLIITPQKAVIHQLVPPIMAIVTENKNIIKMYQEIFYALWDKI